MALTETGHTAPTLVGQNALTKDDNGKAVVVVATTEAIDDYGWPDILDVASEKYEAGDFDNEKAPPQVHVTTSDLKSR